MDDILLKLLEITIIACIILITRYVIPAIKTYMQDSAEATFINDVVAAVKAAEQTVLGEKKGSYKKDLVVKLVTQMWPDIDTTELDTVIEWAVYEMKKGF